MVTGHPPGNTHVGFEMVNGPFHNSPDLIEGTPFSGIPLDTEEHTEVHVFVSISGTSFFGGGAGFGAVTDPLTINHVHFRADPFVPVSTTFFVAVPGVFHVQGGVIGAGGVAVSIVANLWEGAFIPWVIGDQGSGEVEFIFKEPININGIKSRIPQESIRVEIRVKGKKVRKYGLEGRGIPNGLILVRRVRLLFHGHFRVCGLKIIIQEGDMADNAQAVCEDGELVGITEMAVDVLLFGIGALGGL